MGFSYPPHGFFIHFPSIPKTIHILDMHDFKACQNFHSSHLWNRGSWHWHMCIHVKWIAVCHTFHLMGELTYFFLLKLCLAVSSIEQTAQLRRKWTAMRKDPTVSILVVGNCPWFIFSINDAIVLWRSVKVSLPTTSANFINSSARMELNCHFFRGYCIFPPHTTIFSQLIS